jgi:hypothetical protein
MTPTVLYVAQGKMNLLEPGRRPRPIESKFAQSLVDRATQIQQRNAWKTQGSGAKFMSGRTLWGGEMDDPAAIPVAVTGIAYAAQRGELLYSIATHEITGVFALRNKAGDEQRLFHTADFRISQLSAHPSEDRIACVVYGRGVSNIAVMRGDGGELSDVTQGDTLDSSPCWVPGSSHQIVYQSAGIARNEQGASVGRSASRIERLDIENGDISTLLADEQHDYLQPRLDDAGNLYCIRKPSAALRGKFSLWRALRDLLLFPFRILYALFQFVNFFTLRYTGNTLVTSGGARQKQADLKQLLLEQNLMQAQREAQLVPGRDREGLVAKNWELLKKSPAGEAEVLQRGVLSFDLCGDGTIVYTNGSSIALVNPDGEKEDLGKDQFISQVLVIPAT